MAAAHPMFCKEIFARPSAVISTSSVTIYFTAHGQMRSSEQDWIWVNFLFISCPKTPGIRLYGVEMMKTGDTMDGK